MERPPIYDNRELSWLKFNERVLEEAQDESMPLYERLGFVSIFHNNLDEFFMVRVGSLHDQTLLKRETRENKTNLTAQEQLDLIAPRVGYLLGVKDETFAHIMGRLSERGIVHADMSSLSDEENKYLETFFTREILPIVSPSIIDGQHPFPFLQNKDIYIGVELSGKSKSPTVGIIPCQPLSGRIIYLPGQGVRFVLIEDLILHFAHKVFNGFSVQKRWLLRITRNADINVQEALYDHDIDFRDAMGELLKKRKKLSPVRMELSDDIGGKLTQWFCEKLDLAQARVYVESAPLDLSFVWQLEGAVQSQKELFFSPLTPQKSIALSSQESVIEQVLRKDVLLSYPYESIRPFIRLLEEAANDPLVISIKITLYRVANESKVIEELISAAENGKTVTVLLELRARFDEENNINWSKRLEDAGCNVIYGLEELKVHSKLLLITRRSGQGIEYITQIGTGNYNEKTSRLYTDYSLMTANREIGVEVSMVFNCLAVGNTVEKSEHLLVAPRCLKPRIIEMIDIEIAMALSGEEAYIGAKLNSLSDKEIIDKLVEASRAGVKIELLIRGICCLISGVPGYTHNITVTSIVGRFLEHSRVYIFGARERTKVYISSADYMTRNTERRVEVAVPIYNEEIRGKILGMFHTSLKDNVKTRIQQPDGNYIRKRDLPDFDFTEPRFESQIYFYEQAYKVAKNASEESMKSAETKKQSRWSALVEKVVSLFKKKGKKDRKSR